MSNNCPSCFAAPAQVHLTIGLLPCIACQNRQDRLPSPQQAVEIIPEYIKEERQERADSIEQPHLKGELNKRYVDLWGEQAAREKGFSQKEIDKAKYVMDGVPQMRYYNDRT